MSRPARRLPEPEWLSCAEAGRRLSVSRETIRKLAYEGEFGEYLFLPSMGVRVRTSAINAWVRSMTIRPDTGRLRQLKEAARG